ncbi:type II secretion system F family protein [Paenibacillus abyssi]|uniref:Type II secretion system protein GspF domain-containing protein n=1 Tax=Paenibacillus abyssi TaxID=1340531 RepID=A0A917CYP9_9BACL|nr:type II secretion system F family protein [Paenibacillus abyssi]GGG04852.1 hypothetical protein GCM10010916_22450 [Paenibacillus abyssi]
MAGAAAFALLLLWMGEAGWLILKSKQKTGSRVPPKGTAKAALLGDPFLRAFERLKLWSRSQTFMTAVHRNLVILNGTAHTVDDSKHYVAETIGIGYLSLCGGLLLSWAAKEPAFSVMGLLLAVLLPTARIRDIHRKVARRKQDMLLALPELLSKLMLLVGAGETVVRALMRCLESHNRPENGTNPLYVELERMCNELHNGTAFPIALESFSKRCSVQEVSIFTTTVLLNYRRGGERFTLSLRELSYTLWEKRKAVARSRGEEASSKLVFPLVIIFLVLMVLVASPAVLLLG